MMKKRLFCLALSALLAISTVPISISAWADAEGETFTGSTGSENDTITLAEPISGNLGSNIKWVLDTSGTLSVSGGGEWEYIYPMPWDPYKSAIKHVVFEDGVTDIGCKHAGDIGGVPVYEGAFYECKNLIGVTIPDSVKMIDHYSFYKCAIETVTIPKGVEFIGENAFGGSSELKSINVDENNAYFSSVDGVLFNKDKTEIIKYPTGKSGDEYIIPDGVTVIGGASFIHSTNLKSITIPESAKIINRPTYFCTADGGPFEIYGLKTLTVLSKDIEFPSRVFEAGWYTDTPYCSTDLLVYGYYGSTIHEYLERFVRMQKPPVFIPLEDAAPLYNFTDVTNADSIYKVVKFVVDNGLFNGTSETTFSPDTPMTRAMFVTVLGRYAKADTASYVSPTFTDSVSGQWYTSYVEWAAANNVVSGYGDGIFGINDNVTIEQACVILARFAEFKEAAGYYQYGFSSYGLDDVSDWAADSVKWAINNYIYENDFYTISPQAPASRALIAEMMYAFSLAYGN